MRQQNIYLAESEPSFLVMNSCMLLSASGTLKYRHDRTARSAAFDFFKFDVVDMNGNRLMDQTFYIDILGK